MNGLDHVAILVADLDAAIRLYRDVYGLPLAEIEEVPTEKVRVAIFGHGAGRIELVSPSGPDSPMAKAIEKRGEGLHHVCLEVPDIEKAYGVSHDRASDVLTAGKGDCTEHSVLFVALARALGIPARGVHGLVYARYEDGRDALYWHAWAEVKSGGEWIAIDPTFGQPVADATHVALGEGPQVDTVGLLGALKVVGVEVKEGK